jgi:hypothetical protein
MTRRLVLVIASLVVLATFAAPGASATTTKVPFSGVSRFGADLDLGDRWLEGTVLHTRGMVEVNYIDGAGAYVSGTSTVTINFDLDLATGDGAMWGKETLEPYAFPGSGYTCSWQATWDGWSWIGKDVCHGYGDLKGWQVRYIPSNDPSGVVPGVVFLPGS